LGHIESTLRDVSDFAIGDLVTVWLSAASLMLMLLLLERSLAPPLEADGCCDRNSSSARLTEPASIGEEGGPLNEADGIVCRGDGGRRGVGYGGEADQVFHCLVFGAERKQRAQTSTRRRFLQSCS
jgi:hypothetical protein